MAQPTLNMTELEVLVRNLWNEASRLAGRQRLCIVCRNVYPSTVLECGCEDTVSVPATPVAPTNGGTT